MAKKQKRRKKREWRQPMAEGERRLIGFWLAKGVFPKLCHIRDHYEMVSATAACRLALKRMALRADRRLKQHGPAVREATLADRGQRNRGFEGRGFRLMQVDLERLDLICQAYGYANHSRAIEQAAELEYRACCGR